MSRQLIYYMSQEIVRERYKALHRRALSAAKARSIALHVEQAVNFLDSAKSAPITIRPLSQFYGIAALCRAVAMFRSVNLAEESMSRGHGLALGGLEMLQERRPMRGFLDLRLTVGAGLFTDVATATRSASQFRLNSSRPNFTVYLDSPPVGSQLSFDGLLRLLPDVWTEHTALTGVEHHLYEVDSLRGEGGHIIWVISSTTPPPAELLFPVGYVETLSAGGRRTEVKTTEKPMFQPVERNIGPFGVGETLLVPPLTAELSLPPIAVLYATSFVLSMLARYRLSDWLAVWRGEKGDAARPIFEGVMAYVQQRGPQIGCDMLEDRSE